MGSGASFWISCLDAGIAGRAYATDGRIAFVRTYWRSGPQRAVVPGSARPLGFGKALAPTEPVGGMHQIEEYLSFDTSAWRLD